MDRLNNSKEGHGNFRTSCKIPLCLVRPFVHLTQAVHLVRNHWCVLCKITGVSGAKLLLHPSHEPCISCETTRASRVKSPVHQVRNCCCIPHTSPTSYAKLPFYPSHKTCILREILILYNGENKLKLTALGQMKTKGSPY